MLRYAVNNQLINYIPSHDKHSKFFPSVKPIDLKYILFCKNSCLKKIVIAIIFKILRVL